MAFSKPLNTRGTVGGYIRPVAFRLDDNTRELSVLFGLYVDKAHSDRCKPGAEPRDQALVDVVAKLRVSGERYDAAFGSAARTAAAQGGADIVAMIYDAAKAVSKGRKKSDRDDPEAQVISDFGPDVFADARTV